jgi:hypothetical protein
MRLETDENRAMRRVSQSPNDLRFFEIDAIAVNAIEDCTGL